MRRIPDVLRRLVSALDDDFLRFGRVSVLYRESEEEYAYELSVDKEEMNNEHHLKASVKKLPLKS